MQTINRPWIAHVDDEREIGNSVIVTLQAGWFFKGTREGVRGYDTMREAKADTTKANVEHNPHPR
ncbi:hypothetical protein UFOVP229_42 [uncultured Caudovirales phage]|uniref:Uncharacterized protein n=1 Tax=uncultured Caudovirales phage TaxID=2100421 RepID=A0A6J7WM93_9CAUD|nr:hypothetical protein UFOVP229_42 [uncultured Caudovirales phage]